MESDTKVHDPTVGRPTLTLVGPDSQFTRQAISGVFEPGRALPVPSEGDELPEHRGVNGS